MPDISSRGNTIPASPIRKLTPLADEAKRQGVKVYHLNIGQPDLPTPPQAIEALRKLDRKTLEYSPSDGYRPLREKFVQYYRRFGIDVSPDEIIITAGGSEALLYTFFSCFDAGDEVIMTEPCYANYISFAKTCGIVMKTVPSHIKDGFALPAPETFENAITQKTKGILLCNPNNPTGYLYSRKELETIRDIVRRHNLFLVCDEVYREFVYAEEPFLSSMLLEGIRDNVVMIDSVSKRYSECGIRIGMVVTHNSKVHDTVMKYCQARLSPPLLGQIAAAASIDGTEQYSADCYKEYRERRDLLIEGLNRIPGVFSPVPNGAFYTVASLPVENAEDFCKWLLTDFRYEGETVMMAPAAGFYSTPGLGLNEVRMAYVLKKEDLRRALLVLEKALEVYPKRTLR